VIAIEPKKLLIFTAIRAEAKAVRRALEASAATIGVSWQVRIVGIRANRLDAALPRETIGGIILAGFAGALDPSLKVGDVVVEGWSGEPLGFRCGKIHTAGEIVATPAAKAVLFAATRALAVDMEGEIVRQAANTLGVPFLHVRAITDSAADSLEPAVLGFVDDVGSVRPMALTLGLLRRPGLIPELSRLGVNARLAGRNLGNIVTRFMSADDALGHGSQASRLN
jgi:adenosylhomocysteine nucleosidase